MENETVVNCRPDREIRKQIIIPGDYESVPYEESCCKINVTEVICKNEKGPCEIESDSRVFSPSFDGTIVIGDSDCFIDKDFELILQQMCSGETCVATMVYKDEEGRLVKEISCKIELKEMSQEELISDWTGQKLFETSLRHRQRGVDLVKQNKIPEAFRRFSKALKMAVAAASTEDTYNEDQTKEMITNKVTLYNNLAHCQLQFNEFAAAQELCNKALGLDPDNVKALYRRCLAYSGLHMYEEAWSDIQKALVICPNDKAAKQKANALWPKIEQINKNYTGVIRKMFG